ncbi:MAG: hypothetical protein J2O44_01560 [Porphyrobacter sp.]|nr:hypothetical protein [Porphyrobacter sp.]
MIKLLPILGLAMLAACNQGPADKAQAAAAPAGPHSNAAPGTYTHTAADGTMVITHLEGDGSYTDWVAGEMREAGKWSVDNNKTCFHPNKGAARCGSDGPMGPDGSYTVTPDQGAPYTVTKTA